MHVCSEPQCNMFTLLAVQVLTFPLSPPHAHHTFSMAAANASASLPASKAEVSLPSATQLSNATAIATAATPLHDMRIHQNASDISGPCSQCPSQCFHADCMAWKVSWLLHTSYHAHHFMVTTRFLWRRATTKDHKPYCFLQ